MKKLLSLLFLLPLAAFANSERELTSDEISVIEDSVKKKSGYKTPIFKHKKFIQDKAVYCGLVSEKEGSEFNLFLVVLSDNNDFSAPSTIFDRMVANLICRNAGYVNETDELDGGLWNYSEDKDEMRNQSKYYASLRSENSIITSFKKEDVGLYLRKSTKDKSIFFTLDKGLFSCDPCKIAVKIDDNPITYLNAERGESYDALFLTNKKQRAEFVKQMKKGTKLIVELPIYNYEKQQVKFTVKGLKWDHF